MGEIHAKFPSPTDIGSSAERRTEEKTRKRSKWLFLSLSRRLQSDSFPRTAVLRRPIMGKVSIRALTLWTFERRDRLSLVNSWQWNVIVLVVVIILDDDDDDDALLSLVSETTASVLIQFRSFSSKWCVHCWASASIVPSGCHLIDENLRAGLATNDSEYRKKIDNSRERERRAEGRPIVLFSVSPLILVVRRE